jgi:hypothetical protein
MTRRTTTLAKHPLSPAAELWLRECANSPDTPTQILKVRLHQRLPTDFSPELIDPRLYTSGEVTPMGLWRIDRHHPRLQAIDQTIRDIQRRVKIEPPPTRLTAAEIAHTAHLSERAVGEALYIMGGLGNFFSGGSGSQEKAKAWTCIELAGPYAYDEYLRYEDLGKFLERLYQSRGTGLDIALSHSTLHSPLRTDPMPEKHGPNYPLLGIGIALLLIPLAFATLSPDAFQRANLYLRLIAGLGGAMVTAAAIPGTIKAKLPGVQVAGPIAVFAILYFFNPPAVLNQALNPSPPSTQFVPWHSDYPLIDAPYLVCAVPTFPAHSIAKVGIAGDWRNAARTGVGPCDRVNGWGTFVVTQKASDRSELMRELYQHPSIVTADSDYRICLQVTTQSTLSIQDALRFSITKGTDMDYNTRAQQATCPVP